MLKLQDVLSFQDVIGRSYTAAQTICTLPGGDVVYGVAGQPDLVFVRLNQPDAGMAQAIRLMANSVAAAQKMDRVLWPELECRWRHDNAMCGFLAKRLPQLESMIPLPLWMIQQDHRKTEPQKRLMVGGSLLGCIRQIYRHVSGYVLGRFSADNFAVAPQGTVFLVDSWHCGTQRPRDIRTEPPELQIGPHGGLRFHVMHDVFQFAQLLFELLTGVPAFGGHEPQTCFPDRKIADMIANGESIFYYEYLPECAAVIGRLEQACPEVARLLRETLDYADWESYTQYRPGLAEWFEALPEDNNSI